MNHIVKSENMSKSHDGGDSFQIADCRFRCAEESIEDNNSTTQSRVCQSQVMLFRHLETLREYTQHAETKTKRKRAPNPNTRYMNMLRCTVLHVHASEERHYSLYRSLSQSPETMHVLDRMLLVRPHPTAHKWSGQGDSGAAPRGGAGGARHAARARGPIATNA